MYIQTLLSVPLALLLVAPPVMAQETLNKSFDVVAGSEQQIGIFGRLKPDCSIGPVDIRVLQKPDHGTLEARRAQLTAGTVPQCPDTPVPVAVFQYIAPSDYVGVDFVVIEIQTDEGQSEQHNIDIVVKSE